MIETFVVNVKYGFCVAVCFMDTRRKSVDFIFLLSHQQNSVSTTLKAFSRMPHITINAWYR